MLCKNNMPFGRKTKRGISVIAAVFLLCATLLSAFSGALPLTSPQPVSAESAEPTPAQSLPVWNGTTAATFAGGTGTATDPFQISSGAELKLLADLINRVAGVKYNGVAVESEQDFAKYNAIGIYYKLTSDILLNDLSLLGSWSEGLRPRNEWTPIGGTAAGTAFNGNFDGAGHTVFGLFIYRRLGKNLGLFGNVAFANIKNLTVAKSLIAGAQNIGAIAGSLLNGSIINCHSFATLMLHPAEPVSPAEYNAMGGIVGQLLPTATAGVATTAITIDTCRNSGKIICADTAAASGVGGITGYIQPGSFAVSVRKCSNVGLVMAANADAENVGGIAGMIVGASNTGSVNFSGCYNNGKVSGEKSVGGILGNAGSAAAIDLRDCFNTGEITATGDEAGGIIGCATVNSGDCVIRNSYNKGSVYADNYAGGIAGYITAVPASTKSATVENCYNIGNAVTNGAALGSIFGMANKAGGDIKITKCYYPASGSLGTGTYTPSGCDSFSAGMHLSGTPTKFLLTALREWVSSQISGVYSSWTNDGHPMLVGISATQDSTVWNGTVAVSFAGGSGTVLDPYQIATAAQLALLASGVNSGAEFNAKATYFVLTADIYLNDITDYAAWSDANRPSNEWTPIGTADVAAAPAVTAYAFRANFDGAGHTIYGMFISEPARAGIGLFGASCGVIKNLRVEKSVITGKAAVGGIVGVQFEGKISACENAATVIALDKLNGMAAAGGIAGLVWAKSTTGALADSVFIENSKNSGEITGNTPASSGVGGIIGYVNPVDISVAVNGCSNTGRIAGLQSIGGIIGHFGGLSNFTYLINNCFNAGSIRGTNNAGGIVGKVSAIGTSTTYIQNGYNKGKISGTDALGEICGFGETADSAVVNIYNCYGSGFLCGEASVTSGTITVAGYYLDGKGAIGKSTGSVTTSGSKAFKSDSAGTSLVIPTELNKPLLTALNDWINIQVQPAGTYSAWSDVLSPRFTSLVALQDDPDISSFAGGSGISSDPYRISTAEQLAHLAALVNAGGSKFNSATVYYVLTNDIYLNDITNWQTWDVSAPANQWTPIGLRDKPFKAVFDGRGYVVHGIYISSAVPDLGLFGSVDGANIRNVGVAEGYITNTAAQGGYSGGIVGMFINTTIVNATLENCFNRSVTVSDRVAGGVAGWVQGGNNAAMSVKNCYNLANVTGSSAEANMLGGVIGLTLAKSNSVGVAVSDCYNAGTVQADSASSYLGGIIGYVNADVNMGAAALNIASTIVNCYNTGIISSLTGEARMGGIVGTVGFESQNNFTATIVNCYNTAEIIGGVSARIGGIVGTARFSDTAITSGAHAFNVLNCLNLGTVSAVTNAGGIIGAFETWSASKVTTAITSSYYSSASAAKGIGAIAAGVTDTTKNFNEKTFAFISGTGYGSKTNALEALNAWLDTYTTEISGYYRYIQTDTFNYAGAYPAGQPKVFVALRQTKMITLTFSYNYTGSGPNVIKLVEAWSVIVPPPIPARSGYSALGWGIGTAENAQLVNLEQGVGQTCTIAIKWLGVPLTVRFVNWNGIELWSMTVPYGSVPDYTAVPMRDPTDQYTYTWAGWSPALGPVTANTTYTATFNAVPRTCTVIFDSNGGTAVATQTVAYGTKVTAVETTKPNCLLLGWYTAPVGGSPWTFSTSTVSGDVTLYARWEQFTLVPHGDSGVPDNFFANYVFGTQLPSPTVASGFEFGGWTNNGVLVTKLDSLTEHTILAPVWRLVKPVVSVENGPSEQAGGIAMTVTVQEHEGIEYTYSWSKLDKDSGTWKEITGATGAVYSVLGSSGNGDYRCTVVAKAGELVSEAAYASAVVAIEPPAPPAADIEWWVWVVAGGGVLIVAAAVVVVIIVIKKKKAK